MLSLCTAAAQPSGRISMNEGWRFHRGDAFPGDSARLCYDSLKAWILPTANHLLAPADRHSRPDGEPDGGPFASPDFDDSQWRLLDLPHDWGIEGPFRQEYPGETGKLEWWGQAWYRKTLDIGKEDRGKRFSLEIDGAMSFSSVWCNGHLAGGWPYGYTSFPVDLTPYLSEGKNTIAIRIDNPPESSRWYPGGGIYRNVWLTRYGQVGIAKTGHSSPLRMSVRTAPE